MVEPLASIETMREMFLHAHKFYSWELSRSMELIYSNCPSEDFFFNLFSSSICRKAISEHFEQSSLPIVANGPLGIAWIAAVQGTDDEKTLHMLGPIFTLSASEAYIRRVCVRRRISDALVQELFRQIRLIPTMALPTVISYAVMLHYCVCGEHIEAGQVEACILTAEEEKEPGWAETNYHGTWEAEKAMLKAVREGRSIPMAQVSSEFSGGRIGEMSQGDPLRQAQNENIVFATLLSRAAVEGGVSPEGAYNIADYYIQRSEACRTVSEVGAVGVELYETIVRRVQQSKAHSQYSPAVSACLDYISTHVMEKISMQEMAAEVGYTAYYLSSLFKKEVGLGVSDYIRRQKIEIAKDYLASDQLSAAEISERLSFSSPSYFAAMFRQETGMTPSEYILSAHHSK